MSNKYLTGTYVFRDARSGIYQAGARARHRARRGHPPRRHHAPILKTVVLLRAISTIATCVGYLATAHAHAYYVSAAGSDSNLGTPTSPFRTLTKADAVAAAGDTVNVVGPTLTLKPFVTSKANIVYRCANSAGQLARGTCKLLPMNGTPPTAILWKNDGGGVIIDGFEVDGRTPDNISSVRIAFYSSPTTTASVTYQYNTVHHAYQHSCNGDGGAGLYGDAWHIENAVVNFNNNIVHDIGPISGCNTVHGIYLGTQGTAYNNLSYRNSGWGITTWHDAFNNQISNNTVFANISGGISVGNDGGYRKSPGWSGVVNNNVIYANVRYGLVIGGGGNVQPGQQYANNLTSGNGNNVLNNSGVSGSCTNCVTAAPVFVNYNPAGVGDYRLQAGSPGINQGTAVGAPLTDLDGNTRTSPDIGAYEYKEIGCK
jgi:hypothetical protein